MQRTPAFWLRRWAWAFIWTPTILMIVPILGLFESPVELVRKHWDLYAMFVCGPWLAGASLLVAARKIETKADSAGNP